MLRALRCSLTSRGWMVGGGEVALVAPAEPMALLDGRYQFIRQLGGPVRAPLMVASDVLTGRVVCIRLQRFSTSMARLAAVPALTRFSPLTGDGPLLPYDFGVDEGTAYVVRDFFTGTSLETLLEGPEAPDPLTIVSVLRRAGEALLAAAEQGFRHPGLGLRHLLVAPGGAVRVAGYDGIQRAPRTRLHDGAMLAALLPLAFGSMLADDQPPVVRALLVRSKTWQATTTPDLNAVLRQIRRCEQQLAGYSRIGEGLTRTSHVAGAVFRRIRGLGPLLHPYLVVLALAVAIVVAAAHVLGASANPGRLVVYPVSTHAATDPATMYPFANPPQALVRTTTEEASTTVATSGAAPTGDAAAGGPAPTAENRASPVRQSASLPPKQDATSDANSPRTGAPPTGERRATVTPARQTEARRSTPAATVSRAAGTQTLAADGRSTVVVTSLTARATTARVTIIGAESTQRTTADQTMLRSASSATTQVTTSVATRTAERSTNSAATLTSGRTGSATAQRSVSSAVATRR